MTDHAARMLKHLSEQMPKHELEQRLGASIASLRGLAQGLRQERMPICAAEVDKVVELLVPLLGSKE